MQWTIPFEGAEIPVIADDEGSGLVVILAPGAGSAWDGKTVEWAAQRVRNAGGRVVRFNFLYRTLGKSMPDRMPVLIKTYRAVIDSVREKLSPEKLIIGGHSMGGRTASMLEAEGKTADGLLSFAYPLHPPGQPHKLRDAHLPSITTPTLQFSGTEDEFCTPELMEQVLARLDPKVWQLHWVAGADHSFSVKKSSGNTRKDAEKEIEAILQDWLPR